MGRDFHLAAVDQVGNIFGTIRYLVLHEQQLQKILARHRHEQAARQVQTNFFLDVVRILLECNYRFVRDTGAYPSPRDRGLKKSPSFLAQHRQLPRGFPAAEPVTIRNMLATMIASSLLLHKAAYRLCGGRHDVARRRPIVMILFRPPAPNLRPYYHRKPHACNSASRACLHAAADPFGPRNGLVMLDFRGTDQERHKATQWLTG